MAEDLKSHPLSRFEATAVARWLTDEKEKQVKGGWNAVWKRTPDQVAKDYKVSADEVVKAARLDVK